LSDLLAKYSSKELELNGYGTLGLISICQKIEDQGMMKLVSILNDIVHAEETHGSDMLLGSTELWSNFEQEKVPLIKKDLSLLCNSIGRRFVLNYEFKVNEIFRDYFRKFTPDYQEDIVLISRDMISIMKLIRSATLEMDFIFTDSKTTASPYVTLKAPDLLDKAKKHNTIELEMDMFWSRKEKALSTLKLERQSFINSLYSFLLRSFYERIRETILLSASAF